MIGISPAVSTESGFRTPLAISSDGVAWQNLGPSVVGGDALVIAIYVSGATIVALTLTGGAVPSQDGSGNALHIQPPLRAWTSLDGVSWTLAAEPLQLRVDADTGDLRYLPVAAVAGARVLVTQAAGPDQFASSTDGKAWTTLTTTGVPTDLTAELAGAVGGGFVLAGSLGTGQNERPVAYWSADGSAWRASSLPALATVGHAERLATARSGMLLVVTPASFNGGQTWWSSTDGLGWTMVTDFAPLGTPSSGQLVADGDRMVGYDTVTGKHAWTSLDGVTWTEMAIAGDPPPATNGPPTSAAIDLNITPIGLYWRDQAGGVWFGAPGR